MLFALRPAADQHAPHEWAGMKRLRRLVLAPYLLLSRNILILSPLIRVQIAARPGSGAPPQVPAGAASPTVPPAAAAPATGTLTATMRTSRVAARAARPVPT